MYRKKERRTRRVVSVFASTFGFDLRFKAPFFGRIRGISHRVMKIGGTLLRPISSLSQQRSDVNNQSRIFVSVCDLARANHDKLPVNLLLSPVIAISPIEWSKLRSMCDYRRDSIRTHARSLARKSRHVDGVTGQHDFSLHGQLRATIDHVHDHSSARVLRRNYSDTRRYDLMFR